MGYLLDTNVVIDHLLGEPAATQLISELAGEGVAVCAVTYMEAYEGVIGPSKTGAQARFDALTSAMTILPFSVAEARRCAVLRNDLRRQGRRVRTRALDLLIAATALEHDLTLVTRNVADYNDIPDLKLFDPSSPQG